MVVSSRFTTRSTLVRTVVCRDCTRPGSHTVLFCTCAARRDASTKQEHSVYCIAAVSVCIHLSFFFFEVEVWRNLHTPQRSRSRVLSYAQTYVHFRERRRAFIRTYVRIPRDILDGFETNFYATRARRNSNYMDDSNVLINGRTFWIIRTLYIYIYIHTYVA